MPKTSPDDALDALLAVTPSTRCHTCNDCSPEVLDMIVGFLDRRAARKTQVSAMKFYTALSSKDLYGLGFYAFRNHVIHCLKRGLRGESL